MIDYIKIACGVVGGVVGAFIGGSDGLIITLVAFMIIDYATGVINAIYKKELNSNVGFIGICRKVVILALVGVANLLDINVIGEAHAIRTAVIFFYLANEGISILENAAKIGLPIPQKLKNVLEQLKEKDSKDE